MNMRKDSFSVPIRFVRSSSISAISNEDNLSLFRFGTSEKINFTKSVIVFCLQSRDHNL